MSKAIVLLSGGLDSTTVATMAVKEFSAENVVAATLFYGQKHSVELDAAKAVVEDLGIKKHYIRSLPEDIFRGFGSTLVDADKPNPEVTYEELAKQQGPSPTYVPFRNGNLLAVAAALALVEDCDYLYYGAHAEDARNFAYPDCTFEFNGAMANAIHIGTYYKVRMLVPLQWMSKKEVVQKAIEVGAPIHLTHSCYNGTRPACGKCPTCISRIEAFKTAGYKDPIPYAIDPEWSNDLKEAPVR